MIGWLIEDGHDVLTSDGAVGLKWGHEHRYSRGDDFDRLLVVAVHYDTDLHNAFSQCTEAGGRLVAEHDTLSTAERRFVEDVRLRMLGGQVADAELDRLDELAARGLRVGVFETDAICATHYLPDGGDEG